MAVPQIGALAPIASAAVGQPSALGQFGESVANLPDSMAQKQLQRSTVQNEQSTQDDTRLQQIAQMAQSNPAYAQHPELIKGVSDIYKRRGLPAPVTTDENGSRLDVNALIPGKQFGQLSPQELDHLAAMEPAQRKDIMQAQRVMGAPDSFLSGPAQLPTTQGEVTQVLTGLRQEMLKVSDPSGGGPEGFAALVKMYAPILKKAGFDPSQLMNDPQLGQALQARAANETQKLLISGVLKPEEEIKYKQGLLATYQGKLANDVVKTGLEKEKIGLQDQRLQGQLQRWDIQNKGTLGNLAVAQQRVQTYAQMQGAPGTAGLLKYGKFLQSQLGQAQSGYDSLSNIARGYVAAFQPVPADIQGRMDTLKEQIDSLTPLAGAAVSKAAATQASMIRAQTGSSAVTPSGYGGAAQTYARGTQVPGAAGTTFTGRMQDGTYETTAKDAKGNTRWWRP